MFDTLKKNWSRWSEVQQRAFVSDVSRAVPVVFVLGNTLRLTAKRNYGAAVVNAVLYLAYTNNANAMVARRDRLNPSANYVNNSKVV